MNAQEKLAPRLINGKWSIQGTVPVLGRIRKQYASKDDADLESAKLIAQVNGHLANAQIRETLLNKADEQDAQSALHMLSNPLFKNLNITSLSQLVTHCMDHLPEKVASVTLLMAGRSFINYLTKRDRSQNYINGIQNKVNKLYRIFGAEHLITDISKQDIKDWLDGATVQSPFWKNEVSKTTRSNELTWLKNFFNYCEGEDWIEVSPCEGVKSHGKNNLEVQALSLDEAQVLMQIAKDHSNEALCYFALSLFAGLRPEELRPQDGNDQLDWSDFIFRDEDSTLSISHKVGKVSTRRVVTIPENCVQLIKPHSKTEGPVIESSYAQWRGIKDYIRAKAGYRVYGSHFRHIDAELAMVSNDTDRPEYVRDVLRHSAITYRLELDQDKHRVAKWAGNSSQVIDKHYRALVKGDQYRTPEVYAKAYFNIS